MRSQERQRRLWDHIWVKSPVWLSFWCVWPLTSLKNAPHRKKKKKGPTHNPLTAQTLLNSQLQYLASGTNMTSSDTFTAPSAWRCLWRRPQEKQIPYTLHLKGSFRRYPLQFINWTGVMRLLGGSFASWMKINCTKKDRNVIMQEIFCGAHLKAYLLSLLLSGEQTPVQVEGFHCLWRARWLVGLQGLVTTNDPLKRYHATRGTPNYNESKSYPWKIGVAALTVEAQRFCH